jgi:signal transduction histidine kinase
VTVSAPGLAAADFPGQRRLPAALGYGSAALLAALAGAVAARANVGDATAVGLARALIVGAPLAVGFHAWHTRRAGRFGAALMLVGVAWLVAVLAESDASEWYVVGRTAGWSIEILFVYVALAFPHGRLRGRTDRLLVLAMAAVVAIFYLPQLLLAESLQVPSPYTSCIDGCPANVLFALDAEPTTLLGALRSGGALLVFTIDLAVVARLWWRVAESRSVTRRMVVPVLVVAAARAGLMGVAIVARQVGPDAPALEFAAWALALATPALAFAFAIGLIRFQVFAGRVLQQLNARVADAPDAVALQRELAHAFADPQLRLAFAQDGHEAIWSDATGRPLAPPVAGSGRRMVPVSDAGGRRTAILCSEDLLLQPALLEAASSLVGMTLHNRRLESDAARSLHELEASRARLLASAERERRRIERDLHDGAQQRLVALRIELELAEDLLMRDPEAGRKRLRELEHDVDEALDELRSLAHGVYPPLLADRGLPEAVRAVAGRSPVPIDLEVHDVARYPPELESAVYYCVLEALQNALKHAAGARRIAVALDGHGGEVRFSVRDDGAGVDDPGVLRRGSGILGMCDRLAALGGSVDVASAVGVGTTVRGAVPTDGATGG